MSEETQGVIRSRKKKIKFDDDRHNNVTNMHIFRAWYKMVPGVREGTCSSKKVWIRCLGAHNSNMAPLLIW